MGMIKTGIASLTVAFASPTSSVSAAETYEQDLNQRQDIDKVKYAIRQIYGPLLEIRHATTDDQKATATERLLQAQRDITDLFGSGFEGSHTFIHEGKQITANLDVDATLITLTRSGFALDPTTLSLGPLHQAINDAYATPEDEIERRMAQVSTTTFLPLNHEDAQEWTRHLFKVPNEAGGFYPTKHGVDYDIPGEMIREIATPRLNELNALLPQAMRELQQEGFLNSAQSEAKANLDRQSPNPQ